MATVAGGCVGASLKPTHDGFNNFWVGGAFGCLGGTVLGFLWAWRRFGRWNTVMWLSVLFLVNSLLVSTTAIVDVLPREAGAAKRLERLRTLEPAEVVRVEVSLDRGEHLFTLDAQEDVATFLDACSDITPWSPNHPSYVRSWHVVVQASPPIEMELHFEESDTRRACGYFVTRKGNTTWYHGSFRSITLRQWLESRPGGLPTPATGP